MTNQHPITPSVELINQWYKKACKDPYNGGQFHESPVLKDLATQAAQWGADQELEACCAELPYYLDMKLRNTRRPKTPPLKEQALAVINSTSPYLDDTAINTIRRALEQLND